MFFSILLILFGGIIIFLNYINQIMILYLILILFLVCYSNIIEYDFLIGYFFIDTIAYILVLLSIWIVILIWINDLIDYFNIKNILRFLLLISLVFCFIIRGLIEIYIFFEFSLIPLILLIILIGGSPERLSARIYIFIYTLFGSLIFLVLMLMIKFHLGNLNIYIEILIYSKELNYFIYFIFLIFLVKIPLYGVHLWLPKAHTEAPVTGSMILAGLILKLGGYGLYRLLWFFDVKNIEIFKILILRISVIGAIYIRFICLRQVDVKLLIAYSSVCHIGMVLGGIFSFYIIGAYGVLIIIIAHGLCSRGLFYIRNVIYERFKTRRLILLKGVRYLFINLSILWFILLVFNLGAPPSINFFSELLLIYSIIHTSFVLLIFVIVLSFVRGSYSLYLYMQVSHGNFWNINIVKIESIKEIFIIFNHIWPLLVYLINVYLFIEWI